MVDLSFETPKLEFREKPSALAPEGPVHLKRKFREEIETPSQRLVTLKANGQCIIRDSADNEYAGKYSIDKQGNRVCEFKDGTKLSLKKNGMQIELQPGSDFGGLLKHKTPPTRLVQTPEGVSMMTSGSDHVTKLPNGVKLEQHGKLSNVTSKYFSGEPDEAKTEKDGTRVFVVKRDDLDRTYRISPEGTASIEEKWKGDSASFGTTKRTWTPNTETIVEKRGKEEETKIHDYFQKKGTKDTYTAPNGFTVERIGDGGVTLKTNGKTTTFKDGVLTVKDDKSGKEEKQSLTDLKKKGEIETYGGGRKAEVTFDNGTAAIYFTAGGDVTKPDTRRGMYLSIPNKNGGRDHVFVHEGSKRISYVHSSKNREFGVNYELGFTKRPFEE